MFILYLSKIASNIFNTSFTVSQIYNLALFLILHACIYKNNFIKFLKICKILFIYNRYIVGYRLIFLKIFTKIDCSNLTQTKIFN
jgi:hypothetical protein